MLLFIYITKTYINSFRSVISSKKKFKMWFLTFGFKFLLSFFIQLVMYAIGAGSIYGILNPADAAGTAALSTAEVAAAKAADTAARIGAAEGAAVTAAAGVATLVATKKEANKRDY